ncbi:MAG: VCBS repeat-containing protein [Bacteroidetes bacterium]|nr:VCBS repeat-containing protein [Bacteroidota bacterium]
MKKLPYIFSLLFLFACQNDSNTLFKLIPPNQSGITFQNTITENDEYNIIDFAYLYNGGGVSIGDFDNNGLQDIFFTGNMVDNKLYLNQGDLKFKDVTEVAGVASPGKWMYGSAVVDINNDGLMDIYACASILGDEELRANMLFVNQGVNEDGVPVFKDEAPAYGIDDKGHSSHAAFLDYDGDGDLDLFILSNSKVKGVPSSYRRKVNDGSSDNTDHLYRNNGDGTFTDISSEAGILKEGYGLGVAIMDANKDGWSDIYVGNDYITNDLLYMNNGQGKFEDQINSSIKHQSRFSMGNDAADINNDGYQDIITLDMLPETNLRKKTVIVNNGYIVYINDMRYDYAHQHVRNMLQVNNRNMSFSEIGQLAGVHQTEWSWAPLFADFDNDGYKDLLITNGFPKDITDNDFINFRMESGPYTPKEQLMSEIPSVKIPNYAYRNNGDLTFEDVSVAWGFTQPSFSNGAAFADFDNDGDLDYVVNNINDPAFLYENTSAQQPETANHYLRVKLEGPEKNLMALGTKVTLYQHNGDIQYHEHNIYRGYVSTVEQAVHFGLGEDQVVDKIEIIWPDQKVSQLENVNANQTITLNYKDAKEATSLPIEEKKYLVEDATASSAIDFVHEEKDFIDYNIQRNIPHKFSQMGPSLAVGDINGDNLDDFFVGGSKEHQGSLFLQKKDGSFTQKAISKEVEKMEEDMGTLLFDADGDGDLDLYLVSGSFEHDEGSEYMQDRLMLNDGKGNFTLAEGALPEMKASGSCVRAADYDGDGDLDLFVGGRVVVGAYPEAPRSYILNNDKGKFTDVTESVCPEIARYGMISDAIWSDYDGDGAVDLVVVGEFLPVSFFANQGGKFALKQQSGISGLVGWWNSIASGDFDKDGDPDYIVGNVGENNFFCATPDQPVRVTANDFDDNGFMDVIISCYFKAEDGTMKPFPIHSWKELGAQSPIFRNRFDKYSQFGVTTIDELLTPEELEGAIVMEATHMASSYIENLGDGTFKMTKLPIQAQFAPINGVVITDVNQDGNPDALLVGNDYGNEVNVGQYDALTGLVLLGNGKGGFKSVPSDESGFFVNGDAKGLTRLVGADGGEYALASQNLGPLKYFRIGNGSEKLISLQTLDCSAKLYYKDGSVELVELPYGSSYLSQSTRKLLVGQEVTKVEIRSFSGETRSAEIL